MIIKKITFLKAFFFAVLFFAFGFGILSVPEAKAAATLTITSNRAGNTVQMCTQNGGVFTVKRLNVGVGGAVVSFVDSSTGTTMGSCTTLASGDCPSTNFSVKVQGNVKVTASQGGDTEITPYILTKVAGSSTEVCNDSCDNNNNGKIDCKDTADCSVGILCNATGGRCTDTRDCVTPSGTLDVPTVSPTTAVSGTSTVFTFTSNLADVRFVLGGPTGGKTECQATGGSFSCTETITPNSAGTITVQATKSGGTFTPSLLKSIIVNDPSALQITTDYPSSTITVGESTTINFTVKNNANALLQGAIVTIAGAGIPAGTDCTTGSNGQCSRVFTPISPGTITFKATSGGLIAGSTTIEAISAGGGGGGGADSFGLPTSSLKVIIGRAINWLLGVAAGLAVLFIIIGGLFYVTAAGDDSKIETGKKMITYAVIGLMIVGLSYSIIKAIDKMISGT